MNVASMRYKKQFLSPSCISKVFPLALDRPKNEDASIADATNQRLLQWVAASKSLIDLYKVDLIHCLSTNGSWKVEV